MWAQQCSNFTGTSTMILLHADTVDHMSFHNYWSCCSSEVIMIYGLMQTQDEPFVPMHVTSWYS